MFTGKGGKNRRRGKNENESEKRELVFKEDGQGEYDSPAEVYSFFVVSGTRCGMDPSLA